MTKGVRSMNIAIDIDDTLAQTFEYFVPFVAEYFGVDEAELWEQGASSFLQALFRPCRAGYTF